MWYCRPTSLLLANSLLIGTALSLSPLQPNSNIASNQNDQGGQSSRRQFAADLAKPIVGFSILGLPRSVQASVPKSRTEGYDFQLSDAEWKSKLTSRQYEILRDGGTERPYTSILEGEERPGKFSCAGCGTDLFQSEAKFHSGTGWPSFATALEGVEVKKVTKFEANLAGAEIRCATCGGQYKELLKYICLPIFHSFTHLIVLCCRTSWRRVQ